MQAMSDQYGQCLQVLIVTHVCVYIHKIGSLIRICATNTGGEKKSEYIKKCNCLSVILPR